MPQGYVLEDSDPGLREARCRRVGDDSTFLALAFGCVRGIVLVIVHTVAARKPLYGADLPHTLSLSNK